METIFKKDDPVKFWDLWNRYTKERRAGPRYLKSDYEYLSVIMRENETLKDDLSFVAHQGNSVLACALLPVEEIDGVRSVSVEGGFYTPLPLTTEKHEKETFTLIDDLAKKNKINKMEASYNILQKYEYLDTSILTYIVDTSGGDELGAYRKGHRSDVKRLMNDENISVLIADAGNPAPELHHAYERIRRGLSGRLDRTKETYAAQYQQLLDGNAALFALKQGNEIIACSYFFYAQDKARYGSSAHDIAYENIPAAHLLMHEARRYFSARGIAVINSELPSNPGAQFDYYPDEKWHAIARFKRGFPGHFSQEFRGIKYFSPKIFEQDLEEFSKKYKKAITDRGFAA